jgi:enoyl-CoA hydratase/carnithine racemase
VSILGVVSYIPEVLHEIDAGVAIVTLNRPESMNGLSRPVADDVRESNQGYKTDNVARSRESV